MRDVTSGSLVDLCVKMAEEFEQALALGALPDASWRERANCKGLPNRYWDTGRPSSAPKRKPMPGDPEWTPVLSILDSCDSAESLRSQNIVLGGYKCHVAMGFCGACDVRLDCGLAAVDEEPLASSQHLIRGGTTAMKRGELMRRHKKAVAARPAVLYKRKCANGNCRSIVGNRDPDVLLCFNCRIALGDSKAA